MIKMFKTVVLFAVLHLSVAIKSPIIGILSQPSEDYGYDTFIAASYVKFLEAAGARVIPIWINQTNEYYQRAVTYTNGVLFPGGEPTPFNVSGSYGEAARTIYRYAKNVNDKGHHYVIWGTCLGFEALPYAATGVDIRTKCNVTQGGMPLDFEEDFSRSKLFREMPEEIFNILLTQKVTFNFHKYCLYRKSFQELGIEPDWHILSTNRDNDNNKFISSIESIKYPFYGVQFHPEKNAFEFQEDQGFPHSLESIKAMQYFANFLVNEARRSDHVFPNTQLARDSMIYNWCPKFSEPDGNYYSQIYGFSKEDYEKNQLL